MGLKDYSAIYKGGQRIIAAYRGETQIYGANIEPTAPGAFASGAWSVATGNEGEITITVSGLPSSGGSAITGIVYAIDGGAAVSLGAGTGTYTVSGLTAGASVSVQIAAVNAIGQGAFGAAKTVSAGAAIIPAPTNTTAPSISGTATVGEILTADEGVWTNSPTLTLQWLRDGAAISGATGSTYTLVAADEGANISVRVTATNAGGSTVATSASVGPVEAGSAAPTILPLPVDFGVQLYRDSESYKVVETIETYRALYTGSTIYVSEAGDDGTGTGTEAAPFATLDAAVAAATDWQTISIAPGYYAGLASPLSKSVRFARTGSGRVHIGSFLGTGADWVFTKAASYWSINSLTASPGPGEYIGGVVIDPGSYSGQKHSGVIFINSAGNLAKITAGGEATCTQATSNNLFVIAIKPTTSAEASGETFADLVAAGKVHFLPQTGETPITVASGAQVLLDDELVLVTGSTSAALVVADGGKVYAGAAEFYGRGAEVVTINGSWLAFGAIAAGSINNCVGYDGPSRNRSVEIGCDFYYGAANCSTAHSGTSVLRVGNTYSGGSNEPRVVADLATDMYLFSCNIQQVYSVTARALIMLDSLGTTGTRQLYYGDCTFSGTYDTTMSDPPGIDNNSVNDPIVIGLSDDWPFSA